MATVTITNHAVFPTGLDVHGGTPGLGTVWTEQFAQSLFKALARQQSFIVSGFDPPSTGGGTLTKAITGGEAVISGYRVKGTASNNITFDASTTNHLYLQLVFSGIQVSGLELITNTSGVKPANSVKIATVVTNGSNPTTVTDQRPQGRAVWGVFHGGTGIIEAGTSDWTVSGAVITFGTAFFRAPIVQALPVTSSGRLAVRCEARSASSITLQAFDETGNEVNADICFKAFL